VTRAPVDPLADNTTLFRSACRILRSGGVIAFPTESSYGLGAHFENASACGRIFDLKGRDPESPLPLLIPDGRWLRLWAAELSPGTVRVAERFWPGVLTLIVRAGPSVPAHLVSADGKIGLRMPFHPVALALLRMHGEPVTGTSANRSGEPGLTTGAEVERVFGPRIDLILDAGPTPGAAPSTVLDVSVDPPRVLRSGPVSWEELSRTFREPG